MPNYVSRSLLTGTVLLLPFIKASLRKTISSVISVYEKVCVLQGYIILLILYIVLIAINKYLKKHNTGSQVGVCEYE